MVLESLINKIKRINEETEYASPVRGTLERIEKICLESSGKKNSWYNENRLYFMEWPEFSSGIDGFVTGDIYEKVGASSRLVGSYKIDNKGNIIKFPYFVKK